MQDYAHLRGKSIRSEILLHIIVLSHGKVSLASILPISQISNRACDCVWSLKSKTKFNPIMENKHLVNEIYLQISSILRVIDIKE